MATWNTQLHFQRGMMLEETTTASGSGGGGGGCVGGVGGGSGKTNKSTAVWITDFVVMANCNKIVMSSSSRELVFSDVSTQSPKCQYKVQGEKAAQQGSCTIQDNSNPFYITIAECWFHLRGVFPPKLPPQNTELPPLKSF